MSSAKKHLKRLNAPSHWMLNKLGGEWAPRPTTGPHKLRECMPLTLILRNRLKYALTRRECNMITMRRLVQVDGKVRTDLNFPAGFMDVISFENTSENFRLLYDTKGRFYLKKIKKDEAQFKLCRVNRQKLLNKTSGGFNRERIGTSGAAVPVLYTHDARTCKYPDPEIKVNDTVKVDLSTGKIVGYIKFEVGNVAMITRGANIGRVGIISKKEKHPGSFDIIRLTDRRGRDFATRAANVFVIGKDKPWVSLPKERGVKTSIEEDRDAKAAKAAKNRG